MSKRELRAQQRELKKQLRAKMKELKRSARERMDADPRVRAAKRRRRIQQGVGASLLLLLLLFIRCDCSQPPVENVVAVADAGVKEPVAKVVPPAPKVKKAPLKGKLESTGRGKYEGEATAAPSWLDEFQLQVAARSTRLAECFNGTDRPGALRWTASVNGESGTVSDHEFDWIGGGGSMGTPQRKCLITTLSNPGYKLKIPKSDEKPLPSRVSLVIEF